MMKHWEKMVDRDDWQQVMRESEAARLARMARAEQERRKQMIATIKALIDIVFVMACGAVVLFCVYLALWGGR